MRRRSRLRLATRTGLASLVAAASTLLLVGAAFRGQFEEVLRDRVDRQLSERAETAPILAAVADRLARSELRGTVEGARVATESGTVEVGLLPDEPLPPIEGTGWSTAHADGQAWRLYTVAVVDVPAVGDHALVQLAAPLGDVDEQARTLRRRALLVGLVTISAAGLIGYLLGSLASRPLVALGGDADALDGRDPSRWRVGDAYGPPEVDAIAATLNTTLERLRDETERRGVALEAARSFAASASHELRTPLQSALTNLDIAASAHAAPDERAELAGLARAQLLRMAAALEAVGALADAELADPSWFDDVDLADLAATVVDDERRRDPGATVVVDADGAMPVHVWVDGVRLALANLVRNALRHGRPVDGRPATVTVTVQGTTIVVDDDGPGVPVADRARVLERFERGATGDGSGLGLAFAQQVAAAHGGTVVVGDSPTGGARVTMTLG